MYLWIYLDRWIYHDISGWWLTYPSEKYEFVSWDDDIPNIWKNKNVPNHQPDMYMDRQLYMDICVYIYI